MGYRFDVQNYGIGKLAFDAQTYSIGAGISTTQNVFVDVYILPNSVQTYTRGAVQTGAVSLVITASASQNFVEAQRSAQSFTYAANAARFHYTAHWLKTNKR